MKKTYKLYVAGAFPRSESGRSYVVESHDGRFLANAAWASRKDVRDAVGRRARRAAGGRRDGLNRGQVLYRVAELLEDRRDQSVAAVRDAEGVTARAAQRQVDAAIDRWVWYAGWTDKVAQVAGSSNPVAGPYFNFSVPEPTGVIGVVAPTPASLLGLVSVVAPAIAVANTVVVVADERRPLPRGHPDRGARDVRRARRRRQPPHRARRRARAGARRAPRRRRPRPRRGGHPSSPAPPRPRARRTSSASRARVGDGPRLVTATRGPRGCSASSRRRPSGTRSGAEARTCGRPARDGGARPGSSLHGWTSPTSRAGGPPTRPPTPSSTPTGHGVAARTRGPRC